MNQQHNIEALHQRIKELEATNELLVQRVTELQEHLSPRYTKAVSVVHRMHNMVTKDTLSAHYKQLATVQVPECIK
jgi:cell division protein FtsB